MILNKCPKCGAELEFNKLCQYTIVSRILKNGKVSKKIKRKTDNGSMEAAFISCEKCDFATNCDLENKDFMIWEQEERFMYEEKEGQ